MKATFPDRPLFSLEPDHPVFSCYFPLEEVGYSVAGKGQFRAPPYMEGINIGCRTAVYFTPYDLSCGWSGHTHAHGERVDIEDARKLGANLICYILANYRLGRFLATEKIYFEARDRTRDELAFAQVIHAGDWDPDPSAAAGLLRYMTRTTTLAVQFKKVSVDLRSVDAFKHPIIYMTGHREFTLGDNELTVLRSYIKNGGILLADACCGRKAFDRAFRREIQRVTGAELREIPLDHPFYRSAEVISTVSYGDYHRALNGEMNRPRLEGINYDGVLAVIYSRDDLGNGWEGFEHPYSLGYSQRDALRIGANAIVYAMTH